MKAFVFGCIIFFWNSIPVIAQNNLILPSSILENDTKNFKNILNFPQLDEIVPPTLETQPRLPLPATVVIISEFQITGNTVFTDEDIQRIIASSLGKVVGEDELQIIENVIEQFYAESGYLGVSVFISDINTIIDSSSNQAIVKIQILERLISDIQILGAGHLTPFLKRRVKDFINQPFNSDKFSNEMRFLLRKEAIESLQVDFLQTELLNESRLLVDVKKGDIINLSAFINNQRSPSSGELERGINFLHRNFSGLGDEFNLQYRNTEGSNLAELNYEVPVNDQDASISVNAFFGHSSIIRQPIDVLDIDSETIRLSGRFRQPVVQRSSDSKIEEVAVGIGFSRIDTKSTQDNDPLPFFAGSNAEGDFRSTVLNLFQDYSQITSRSVLLLSSSLDIGLPVGATNDPIFRNGTFIKGGLQGVFLYSLNRRVSLFSRWDGQIGDRTLSNNEQYTIGGQNSVRGADLNISRDYGIDFSQEIRTLLFENKQHQLQLAPFFDIGYAANRSTQVFEENLALASLGIALRYQFDDRLFATFEYAQPILGRESFQDGSDFKFSLTGKIF